MYLSTQLSVLFGNKFKEMSMLYILNVTSTVYISAVYVNIVVLKSFHVQLLSVLPACVLVYVFILCTLMSQDLTGVRYALTSDHFTATLYCSQISFKLKCSLSFSNECFRVGMKFKSV